MGCNKKKKAFTLTELLVVVLVLGILAGVAVPKFKRVLETRKTTEAENMLAAVRTEQEKRCIMGKNYRGLGEESKLDALAKATKSANYSYSLTNAGVSATSNTTDKSKAYTLRIKSYKDGQICCEGVGCSALNKNYVSCDSLTVPDDECSAESGSSVVEPTPEPEPEPEPTPSCNEDEKDESPQPQVVGNMECLVARKATCENGTWVYQNLGILHPTCHCINTCGENETLNQTNCTCEATEKQCSGSSTQTVSIDNGTCTQTRTCNTSTGNWSEWETDESTCSCESGYTYNNTSKKCEPEGCSLTSAKCQEQYGYGYWNVDYEACTCKCSTCSSPSDMNCYIEGIDGSGKRWTRNGSLTYGSCNTSTCQWDTYECNVTTKVWVKTQDSIKAYESFFQEAQIVNGVTACSNAGDKILVFMNGTKDGGGCGIYNCTGVGTGACCMGGTEYTCTKQENSYSSFEIGCTF